MFSEVLVGMCSDLCPAVKPDMSSDISSGMYLTCFRTKLACTLTCWETFSSSQLHCDQACHNACTWEALDNWMPSVLACHS